MVYHAYIHNLIFSYFNIFVHHCFNILALMDKYILYFLGSRQASLKVLITNDDDENSDVTKNVVYHKIFSNL